ncbi:MAG: FtsX-like permease family protein [Mariniphaga sp.]|nr:FtsX-like permease family protein [Mariniphaga sp.]
MVNKDLGFDKNQMMIIERAGDIGTSVKTFKEELLRIPGIENVSASTAVPGRNNNNNGYMIEGRSAETFLMQTSWVDYDFFDVYDIELADGRAFERTHGSDQGACVVNQKAMEEFGIKDVNTERFIINLGGGNTYIPIIGVSENFHFRSLHSRITPYIMRFKTDDVNFGYISVKFVENATAQTINQIEEVWKKFALNNPLQYFFMENDHTRIYRVERQNAQLSILFAILGIFIAALGLFGLTSFTIEQRTKEVGVRKAMGASNPSIFYLVSKEIIVLVCIATIVAWPLIYFVANNWLQNYYYRIDLRILEFVIGFVIAITIALVTISYRTIKSVKINPADTLRYE